MAGVLLVAACGSDDDNGASAPVASDEVSSSADSSGADTSEANSGEGVTLTYPASQNWVLDSEKLFLVIGIAMPINDVTLTRVVQETHLMDTQLGIILPLDSSATPTGGA